MSSPIIGITPNLDEAKNTFFLHESYASSVMHAGGIPFLLPPTDDAASLMQYTEMCDGFLLSGGADIHPSLYGGTPDKCGPFSPKRDALELALIPRLLESGKPILGICRGMQMLNVVCGGSLWRDINSECNITALHRMPAPSEEVCHTVIPKGDTLLSALCGAQAFAVNSYHHQAVRTLGTGLCTAALSEDGLTEAICLPSARFVLGVQWHPERIVRVSRPARALLEGLIHAART